MGALQQECDDLAVLARHREMQRALPSHRLLHRVHQELVAAAAVAVAIAVAAVAVVAAVTVVVAVAVAGAISVAEVKEQIDEGGVAGSRRREEKRAPFVARGSEQGVAQPRRAAAAGEEDGVAHAVHEGE